MSLPDQTLGSNADKLAIGLSLLCAIHCLAVPVLVLFLPGIASLAIADESFHGWMVVAVIPISVFALLLGCRKHGQLSVLIFGGSGVALLVAAVALGHAVLGEYGERLATLLGAALVALGHWRNYALCRQVDCPS